MAVTTIPPTRSPSGEKHTATPLSRRAKRLVRADSRHRFLLLSRSEEGVEPVRWDNRTVVLPKQGVTPKRGRSQTTPGHLLDGVLSLKSDDVARPLLPEVVRYLDTLDPSDVARPNPVLMRCTT